MKLYLSGEGAIKMTDSEDRLGMTPEQWEQFQTYTHGFGEQDESGVDISLLRENLRLTPTERFEKHQRALLLMMEVHRAGEASRLRRDSE